jgi:hypothetical protein
MTYLNSFALLLAMFLFFGCKDQSKERTEPATKTAATKIENVVPVKPLMLVVFEHKVTDFKKWRAVFNTQEAFRTGSGLSVLSIGRGINDTNLVYVTLKANSVMTVIEFPTLTETKELMKKSGVIGSPMVHFVSVLRYEVSDTSYRERMMVEYNVKGFQAWLKAYDEKGKNVRAEHGLIDKTIGHELRDTSNVYLFFDISDIKKAKSWLASSELKQFMKDAGIITQPSSHLYKVIE